MVIVTAITLPFIVMLGIFAYQDETAFQHMLNNCSNVVVMHKGDILQDGNEIYELSISKVHTSWSHNSSNYDWYDSEYKSAGWEWTRFTTKEFLYLGTHRGLRLVPPIQFSKTAYFCEYDIQKP